MPDSINTQPPNIADEEPEMAERGRLIKARTSDQPPPNVSWYWIGHGNCQDCIFYQSATLAHPPRCLNPEISEAAFRQYVNFGHCPEFKYGINPERATPGSHEADTRDVMQAAGLAEGKPSQEVKILKNIPWTPHASERAHAEQARFQDAARFADSGFDSGSQEDIADRLGADDDDA